MKGILLPSIIENIATRKDNTIKITIGTNELSQGNAGELFSLVNKLAVVYISPKEAVDQRELDQIDKIDPEFQGKTQSQRLRAVLFKLFDQDKEGFKDFDTYYKSKTEKIIEHLKTKINV